MSLQVEPSSVAAIMSAPNFPALIEEYAAESAIDGMPPPLAKMEQYQNLEGAGFLHALVAIADGEMLGFMSVLAAPLLHYGRTVAVSESFFVAKDKRCTMAGLKLLVAAEALTLKIGSPGLLVSAPYGSRLADLLPKCGYTLTNSVFFKKVGNG